MDVPLSDDHAFFDFYGAIRSFNHYRTGTGGIARFAQRGLNAEFDAVAPRKFDLRRRARG